MKDYNVIKIDQTPAFMEPTFYLVEGNRKPNIYVTNIIYEKVVNAMERNTAGKYFG